MNRDAILATLKTTPTNEPPLTTALRHKAHSIISATDAHAIEQLPTTLLDLLTQIIKPLFTKTRHPHLTSTGRKSLVASPAPSIASRFLDDGSDEPPWKTSTPFTVPLLEYILTSYLALPFDPRENSLRKTTIEAHFHLLVPPILNMIDDAAPTPYKSAGCKLLAMLCEVLTSTHSEMLKRSGLADVMVDALRTNFLSLPTLTPEADSLALLREVYAAFLGVVDARFVMLRLRLKSKLGAPSNHTKAQGQGGTDEDSDDKNIDTDFIPYQAMLTLVYRHGIMASLAHLSSSSNNAGSLSNTISVPLTALLLRQIPPVFSRMGIHCVKNLQGLLPMVRVSLMDPFLLAAPEMVSAILDIVDCVCDVARTRVQQKWWPEVLRGLVGCWVNCVDESENESTTIPAGKTASASTSTSPHLEDTMARLKKMVKTLGEIVGPNEWSVVKRRLVEEEDDLAALFGD
ncbi:hypothetical protein CLCR_05871 [Cladophialophora carrionii]|uniref:Uncharacterized protein n=1 Tax=Cladophialophora carrionii TaxID=86049 RepID=A0A1C1C7L3_9EURO|nr:hypothetical protein CLCR_05871 [Cladophialophora carrionii]